MKKEGPDTAPAGGDRAPGEANPQLPAPPPAEPLPGGEPLPGPAPYPQPAPAPPKTDLPSTPLGIKGTTATPGSAPAALAPLRSPAYANFRVPPAGAAPLRFGTGASVVGGLGGGIDSSIAGGSLSGFSQDSNGFSDNAGPQNDAQLLQKVLAMLAAKRNGKAGGV